MIDQYIMQWAWTEKGQSTIEVDEYFKISLGALQRFASNIKTSLEIFQYNLMYWDDGSYRI